MKLSLSGTVASRNLSFRRFEDQGKTFQGCVFETRPTYMEISVFRTRTKLGSGFAHHTCNPMKVEYRAGWRVRSQIRDRPRLTQHYLLAINNIKTERNKKADPDTACARFGSTYTEIRTLHRSPKKPQR